MTVSFRCLHWLVWLRAVQNCIAWLRAAWNCFAWSFVSHVDVRWLLVSYQAFVVLCCRCWCVLSWIKASERFPSLLGSVVTEQVLLCQVNLSTNIYCERLEEITDLKIFPECFQGPLKTLWWITCGPQAANCPPQYHDTVAYNSVFWFYREIIWDASPSMHIVINFP